MRFPDYIQQQMKSMIFDSFYEGSKSLHFIEKDVFSFFCAEEHIINFEYYGVSGL